jgi:hypothetical protein
MAPDRARGGRKERQRRRRISEWRASGPSVRDSGGLPGRGVAAGKVAGLLGGAEEKPAAPGDGVQVTALHQLQPHDALLADALCSPTRGADRRPQPPPGRVRRHLGDREGLPRLQRHHHARQSHDRPRPQGQRLPHLVVWQGPQHAGVPGRPGRAVRPVAHRRGLRVYYSHSSFSGSLLVQLLVRCCW